MKFTTAITLLSTTGTVNAFAPNHLAATSKTVLSSYLEQLAGPKIPHRPTAGSGISSYLDSVPTSNVRTGGAGLGSYLDSIEQACDTIVPTDHCAQVIADAMHAVSNGATQPETTGAVASAIGNYLDNLAGNAAARTGGGGIATYLDTVGGGSARVGGPGIQTYLDSVVPSSTVKASAPAVKGFLDALSNGATAPSAPAVKSYLQDVSSGSVAAPTSGSGIASYLDSVPVASSRAGGGGITAYLGELH